MRDDGRWSCPIGPPHLGLWRHVAHTEAVRAAREAAVGDERHLLPQAGPHHHGRRVEHLLHPGPALWPLVADDDHAPPEGLVVCDHRSHHVLLRIEASGGALEARALLARDLADCSLGREVARQDRDVPGRLDRLLKRADDVLAGREAGQVAQVLRHRLAGDGHAIPVQIALLEHVLEDGRRATDDVQVLHHVP